MRFSKHLMSALAVSVFAFSTLPGASHAQSATEQEETENAGEQSTGELALGQEVSDEPKPGDAYIKEQMGDWALRCVVVAEGDDPCQMYQLLSDANGAPIAEFTMFRLPESNKAAAGATIIVPLETALQRQLSIKVDAQPAKLYPFAFCNPVGCYARIGLTAEDVATYKRGAEAVLTIVPMAAPDQTVDVTLSLGGFTAAFDKASVLNQP